MRWGQLRSSRPWTQIAAGAMAALCCGACAHPPPRPPVPERSASHGAPSTHVPESGSLGRSAAHVARSMVGTPYRYGGATPSGFDCSGLVAYSFARAGRPGLPHSVDALADLARPVPVDSIEAGDLLFFSLDWGTKKSHVGIYLGDRRFVHAPSSGRSVEIVPFDHVYWGPRVGVAGRIMR